jgi:putative ABC transport system permease protein
MGMLSDWRYRLRALFRREAVETELDDELRFHFENEVEKLERRGMQREEARRQARLAFGGHAQVAEDCREARGTSLVENTAQDVRYALRQLRANPGFATVMILTLGLAVGANSAIFSVVDGVLLQPLPYSQPNRLAYLYLSSPAYPKFPLNPWDFHDYREQSRSFVSMAAMTRGDLQLSGGSERPVMLHGMRITAGFFAVLGLEPQLGHEFDRKAELPGNEHQVILSHRLWRSRFGASPAILGQSITLNDEPYTVVGVMAADAEHPGNSYHSLAYGTDVDLWWPFTFDGKPSERGEHYIEGIGRLRPGVTLAQAGSELNGIMAALDRLYPGEKGWHVNVIPLDREVVGQNRPILLLLLGAVGMVLLIACANAANLLLARATARRRELAVRLALGARRGRLVRQMLTESLCLALIGGTLGLLTAWASLRALVSLLPEGFPRAAEIHVSAPVFAFTFFITTAAGLLFGLMPALQASRTDPRQGLHEGGRTATGGRQQQRLRSALVVAEVSLACALLIGAGLMLRSFLNQLHLNFGFQQQHVLTASLSLPASQYKTAAAVSHFYLQLTTGLQALPGVASAGAGTDLPYSGYDENLGGFEIEGKQPPPHSQFHARFHVATTDYFQALGIPLLSGRFFTEADKPGARNVLIINHAMARKYWGDQNPVGQRINFFADHPTDKDWTTIVGVVGDVKDKPSSPDAEAAFWWPSLQLEWPVGTMDVVLRANGDPAALAGELRRAVQHLDPTLAVGNVREMDSIVEGSVAAPRLEFILVGLFGGLAIVLAGIGIYGVVAYAVSQRTPEFGVRMALGAQRWDVLRLVLAQVAGMVLGGTALGLLLAVLLGQALRSLIYGVSPADPVTLAAASSLVLATAMLACVVPARKATGVDPMIALRAE